MSQGDIFVMSSADLRPNVAVLRSLAREAPVSRLQRFQIDDEGDRRPDLPYRLELWDAGRERVVAVLALASGPGVGYAAYYAALREYLAQPVTLSLGDRILASVGFEHG